MMELGTAADRPVGVYSLGMRQRLGVAAAILTRPDVLILDEPASGMDPLSLHLVHRVLKNAAAAGSAVLLSTHHLDEVAAYCNRVGILEEGALIDEVDLEGRRGRFRARVSDVHGARLLLDTRPWIREVDIRGSNVVFTIAEPKDLGRVAPLLLENNIGMFELTHDTFDLRSYYRDKVNEERARRTGVMPADDVFPPREAGR
jgi:ABC-2 type transport system ATP-binding protein